MGAHVPHADAEAQCPVCKTDSFLNPNMRLLISPCYHKMCSSCVDRIYAHGAKPCPQCKAVLRKFDFSEQIFENLSVEKEVHVRKRVMKYCARAQESFGAGAAGLRRYNDYLEEVEEIVFNLVSDTDVKETLAKLEHFRRQAAQQSQYTAAHRPGADADAHSEQAGLPSQPQPQQPQEPSRCFEDPPEPDAEVLLGEIRDRIAAFVRDDGRDKNDAIQDENARAFGERAAVRAGGWAPQLYWQRALEQLSF